MDNELLTEQLVNLQRTINEEVIQRIEVVAQKYSAELAERDRIITGLKSSLAQSSKDFHSIQSSGINGLVNLAHKTAKEKGWWDIKRNAPEVHMLIVTEIAEATEAARINNPDNEKEELVDAVIRIMDYFGYMNWNLDRAIGDKMTTNLARPYRHGDKIF